MKRLAWWLIGIAAIVGMAAALSKNIRLLDGSVAHLINLEKKLTEGLKYNNIDFVRNGGDNHLPGNISLSFRGYDGEALLHRLDLMGVCVSTGSACDSKNTQVSHVLQAIGLEDNLAKGTIRISLGKQNTVNDVEAIVEALAKILG